MSSRQRRTPLSPPPNDPNKLIQAILLHPNYKTIAADVEARRNHFYADELRGRFALQVVQQKITFAKLMYDMYEEISKVLDTITAYFNQYANEPHEKRHLFLSMYLMYELCRIVFTIENIPFNPRDPHLIHKKNFSNMTLKYFIYIIQGTVQDWGKEYASLQSYHFTTPNDYMRVFLDALDAYCIYRINHTHTPEQQPPASAGRARPTYLNRLTIDELLEGIELMKITIIAKLNLQNSLNEPNYPHVEATMVGMLRQFLHENHNDTLEMFVYPWYFIAHPVEEYEDTVFVLSPSNYTALCEQRFQDITQPSHKYLVKYLIGNCSILSKEQESVKAQREVIKNRLKTEFQFYTPTEPWDYDLARTIHCPDVNRKYALYDFFLIWYNEVIDDKAKDFWSCYFDVNFIGESGVYLGVQQDLLQTCLDQLAALVPPLFVPTEENSDRFHINRHYVPDEKSKRFIHHELKKTDTFYTSRMFKKLFLQYVGGLITRCMLAGLELPFKLSFYTLGYIYNPHFKPGDMYLLYYLLDHPVKSAETLGLLKVKPEEFQHLYMNFNTHYPITQEDPSIDPKQNPPKNPGKSKKAFVISPKNPELTLANVHEFIYRTAKYVLTTVDSKDPVVIPEKKRKHYTRVRRYNLDLLKAFRKGFYIHPEGIFTNEVVAVHVLDKMINSGGIHIDKYSSWLATTSLVVQYPDTDATTHSPEQAAYLNSLRPQQTLVADVFLKEILAKPDIAIPFDKVEGFDTYIAGKSPKEIKKIKKEFFLKSFIPNLFYFWTSSRTINPAVRYAIAFTINDPANDPYALARLPSSHTCFNTLDLPTFYPSQTREGIRDALMEKLVIAIYKNVGFGVA